MIDDALLIRRYLLGDLPEEDAERFEQEYFVDDDRFADMLAAEDKLVEDFLHRRLEPAEVRRFEVRFLGTPRGRQKVALASALEGVSVTTRKAPWAKMLAIAAAVTVVAIGAGMMREIVVMRHQIERLQGERQTTRSVAMPRPPEVFSIVLSGGQERGSAAVATIVLPHHSATADLWLLLPRDDHPSYTATLQTIDGLTVYDGRALASRSLDGRKAILFRIPSELLEPRTYVVTVSGEKPGVPVEVVEDFSFSVRRP